MYKKFIYGLVTIIAVSAIFYIINGGGASLIADAISPSAPAPTINGPTVESISGIYSCDIHSGCKSTSTLTLKNDNTLEMYTYVVVDNETELNVEKGNWDLGTNNLLIVSITDSASTTYDVPRKLVAQRVASTSISKIMYNKLTYPDFVKPIFRRMDY